MRTTRWHALIRSMAALQERTQAYCAEVKASPDCWRLCADRFATTGYVEVKFWCLQALHEVRLVVTQSMSEGTVESYVAVPWSILCPSVKSFSPFRPASQSDWAAAGSTRSGPCLKHPTTHLCPTFISFPQTDKEQSVLVRVPSSAESGLLVAEPASAVERHRGG